MGMWHYFEILSTAPNGFQWGNPKRSLKGMFFVTRWQVVVDNVCMMGGRLCGLSSCNGASQACKCSSRASSVFGRSWADHIANLSVANAIGSVIVYIVIVGVRRCEACSNIVKIVAATGAITIIIAFH